ncbi:hypothetical protein J8I87_42545 [Paraburkholderia sp. LEh10]|nr:hypothetical protein [Paraburkholderia sp. LEh10]
MWYTDCDLSEAIGGCVADVTENQVTPPVPAPGEYAEREARPARLLLYQLLAESNEAVSSLAKVGPADRQNTLLAVSPDAFWRVWTLLFGQPTDTRPSKSLVAQVAAALLGSRTAPAPITWWQISTPSIAVSSHGNTVWRSCASLWPADDTSRSASLRPAHSCSDISHGLPSKRVVRRPSRSA